MSFMDVVLTNRLLRELNALLMQHGKLVSDYDLPNFTGDSTNLSIASSLIQDELSIPISENDIMAAQSLNQDQSQAYNRILQSVRQQENVVFFIDGLGGSLGRIKYDCGGDIVIWRSVGRCSKPEICSPFRFSYIYNYVMSSSRSFMDSFVDVKGDHYHPKMSSIIPKDKWQKGSKWIALVRRQAEVVVDDDIILPVFKKYCKRRPPIDPAKGKQNIKLQKQHN
ncbi:hypothetical protein GIB67_039813 [Kingdonia uniflora]|uniref:Uncharacterized protein n=1 Tax=Kingdonia uniflora TaxID=39325 RepID=A0A7J7P3N3_9MAGN|nr:hypothetical protein GIB67_039813 [Kingdonia uniflora]